MNFFSNNLGFSNCLKLSPSPFSEKVLVFHDLLGMMSQPNYAKAVVPRFCKPYAHVGAHIHQALTAFKDEARSAILQNKNHLEFDKILLFSDAFFPWFIILIGALYNINGIIHYNR